MSRLNLILLVTIVIGSVTAWLWFFPPRWWLNTIKPVDLTDPVGAGASIVQKYECRQCHLIDGEGRTLGPNLKNVTERLDDVSLRQWLRDPSSIKWDTPMPNFRLSDPEIEAIVAYLDHLDE